MQLTATLSLTPSFPDPWLIFKNNFGTLPPYLGTHGEWNSI
jgi:hypothetical protein